MIYLLDIGNTAIKYCAIAPDLSINGKKTVPVSEAGKVCQAIIASGASKVVLAATASEEIVRNIREVFSESRLLVSELYNTQQMPFASHYAPGEAGIDRLANVAGAIATAALPVVVIDAGSAITLEVVDSDGTFAGGAILPGLRLQARALNLETGRLPEISLEFSRKSIATNTVDAIRAGIILGTIGALSHLIDGITLELDTCPNIVLTGGDAGFLHPHLDFDVQTDPDLTVKGLVLLAQYSKLI